MAPPRWQLCLLLLVSLLLVGARCDAPEEESGRQLVASGTDDSKHLFPHYSPPGTGPGGRPGAPGRPGSPVTPAPHSPPPLPSPPHKPKRSRRHYHHHKRQHFRHHRQGSDESATTLQGRRLLQDVDSEELVASGTDDKKHWFPHYSPPAGRPGAPGRPGPPGAPGTPGTSAQPPSSTPPPPKSHKHKGKPGKGPRRHYGHHKRQHFRHHRQDSDESSTTLGRRLLQDVDSEELVADAEGEFGEEVGEAGAFPTTAAKPKGTAGTAPRVVPHHVPARHHHRRRHHHHAGGGTAQAPFPLVPFHDPNHPNNYYPRPGTPYHKHDPHKYRVPGSPSLEN